MLNKGELRLALPAWLRGTVIGLPFGVIPAGGAEIPTFLTLWHRAFDRRLQRPKTVR